VPGGLKRPSGDARGNAEGKIRPKNRGSSPSHQRSGLTNIAFLWALIRANAQPAFIVPAAERPPDHLQAAHRKSQPQKTGLFSTQRSHKLAQYHASGSMAPRKRQITGKPQQNSEFRQDWPRCDEPLRTSPVSGKSTPC
jgi:hypothetical protein